MIIELGHYALILALVVAAVQSVFPVWGALKSDHRLMRWPLPCHFDVPFDLRCLCRSDLGIPDL